MLGWLGTGPLKPRMVIATRVDDPSPQVVVGRPNPHWQLRHAIRNVLCKAFSIRAGLPALDRDVAAEDQWKIRAPVSIAFPLVGCRSGFGFVNSAE